MPDPHPAVHLKVSDRIEAREAEFLARAPFAVLATCGADGMVEASPKGDLPGFIRVESERGAAGAGGQQSRLWASEHPRLRTRGPPGGDPGHPRNAAPQRAGEPRRRSRPRREPRPAGAARLLAIRIETGRVYFHCARGLLRAGLWRPESWGDRHRVNFGDIFAERMADGEAVRREVEDHVADSYGPHLWANP
ncbi:MAG TPA: pyridoxamine 5'-phosphate oxidase family protein [Paracoccaceae bacterium]|nr:pyridoxamine 5'-phosphate oxidase family protein [Paracoccaceae bacterium]